jgi:hypothetical protein
MLGQPSRPVKAMPGPMLGRVVMPSGHAARQRHHGMKSRVCHSSVSRHLVLRNQETTRSPEFARDDDRVGGVGDGLQ